VEPQRQEAFFEVEPNALDRIELWRIGWEGHERDVRRHAQRFAAVPARAVENECDMLVLCDCHGEGLEKHLHCRPVRVRQDERERVVGARFDDRVDIGGYVALIEEAGRTLAPLPPDMADAPLLPDARLILEIEAQALAFMRTLNFF
jgi:hypothetical protein